MPYVHKYYGESNGEPRYGGERELVPWNEATPAQRARTVAFRATALVAAVVLPITLEPKVMGESGEQISEAQQNTQLLNDVQDQYDSLSLTDKFSVSFIKPIVETSEETHEDGHGLRSMNDSYYKEARIRMGRSCLRGTAYDITPYNNKSAGAALAVDGQAVNVYPRGNEAVPLTFTFDGNVFTPSSDQTRETLIAYNCRFLGNLPVRTAFVDNGEESEWKLAEPNQG